jgi:hypothetical protein
VVSGENDVQAYIKAGYTKSIANAEKNAWRVRDCEGVKAYIAKLRKPQTKRALMTRDDKRVKLRQIVENESIGIMARLRALELDAKIAGDFAPEQHVIEAGPNTLASVEERAKQVRSALNLAHQVEPSGKSPDGMDPPASPVEEAQQAAESETVPEPDNDRRSAAWNAWR